MTVAVGGTNLAGFRVFFASGCLEGMAESLFAIGLSS
jgi:hypothetical protein